ncbi:Energy-coupling factor transporter ATP-binding protein EcfA2 [bioreactor metagenome]|uniref:Energy-coupling factor transporter ATP-binding protein EcfA2 n=1 Tax=bioreactor metagenome TaxID=1076179 RepID=A0A645IVR9_9ZZZZ
MSAYSGGMQRRLHLATALLATPGLLLLDEPTAGADEHSAELILGTVERLRDRDCAVVFVSHRAEELARLCDKGITLEDGRISDTWEKRP